MGTLQGRIFRAFRAFPGKPWHWTQNGIGHKTDENARKEEGEKEGGKK